MFVKVLEGFPGFPYSFARVSRGFWRFPWVSLDFVHVLKPIGWFWQVPQGFRESFRGISCSF